MPSPATTDYDRVAYPSMAHPQTFAANLFLKGFLRGMDTVPPDRCRVLELGCGDGFNLATMATMFPHSTYVGIDYAADAIARGRQMIADVGFKQIRLETGDIRSLDKDLGEFDYILAHGVYSWVPYEVRDALLATIGKHLAPNGVGFVSYLALPGAFMRETARTIMRFHARTVSDPAERARQARSALHLATFSPTEENLYSKMLEGEWKVIDAHSDEGLFHDELSEISAPLLFTDFLAHAQRHELAFLSEAEYLMPFGRLKDEAREQLRPLEENRVLLEQYMDFIEGRRFRQTLLCRPGQGNTLEPERIEGLHLRFGAKPTSDSTELTGDAPLEFRGIKNSVLRAKLPVEKAALLTLHSWGAAHRPFPELVQSVRGRLEAAGLSLDANTLLQLRRFIVQSSVAGLVELAWKANPAASSPPAKPRTLELARWQVKHQATAVVSLTGKLVEINGALGGFLVSLLDGTRDRESLLAEIRRFLTAEQARAAAAGEKSSMPSPDDPELGVQLDRSLQGLTALELIYAE